MTKIGIGITTRNRRFNFLISYKQWLSHLPNDARLVVVDDASEYPLDVADYRFEQQAGIARAKNKCLELLQDCDHVFLVDDDVYPTKPNWFVPYINSGEEHLCLTFTHTSDGSRTTKVEEGTHNGKVVYNLPNGCMLYATRKAIDTVGGMDPAFGIWGYEHVDWSNRIHAFGLTKHPYMDIKDSKGYFYVGDFYGVTESSVDNSVKSEHIAPNATLLQQRKGQKIYVDYGV